VLAGEHVELSPLKAEDHDGLIAAASDGELWTLSYTRVPRPDEMRETIASYLVARDEATMMPFTVRRASTGEIVGVSTFCNVDAANRRVEIGYTWYARSAQQTMASGAQRIAAPPCEAERVQVNARIRAASYTGGCGCSSSERVEVSASSSPWRIPPRSDS
jgi:RimJ/RimL family protein N-acetyltransferase